MDLDTTESDSSDQISSVFDSRSPSCSGTSNPPPRFEEWDRSLRHTDFVALGKALHDAARTVFPNEGKSRYSNVYVLLISW